MSIMERTERIEPVQVETTLLPVAPEPGRTWGAARPATRRSGPAAGLVATSLTLAALGGAVLGLATAVHRGPVLDVRNVPTPMPFVVGTPEPGAPAPAEPVQPTTVPVPRPEKPAQEPAVPADPAPKKRAGAPTSAPVAHDPAPPVPQPGPEPGPAPEPPPVRQPDTPPACVIDCNQPAPPAPPAGGAVDPAP